MSGDRDSETRGSNPTTLRDFLSTNYQLFAVMGIFGALAIYLNTIRESLTEVNPNLMNLGIVVSLSLFIFISISIYLEFMREAEAEERMLPGGASPGLVVFFVPFTLLIGIIIYISTSFEAAIFLLSEIIAFVIGWYLYTVVFQFAAQIEFDLKEAVAEELEQRDESGLKQYAIIGSVVFSEHFGQSAKSILLSVLLALIPIGALSYLICCLGINNTLSTLHIRLFTDAHGTINSIIASFLIGLGIASIVGIMTSLIGLLVETKRMGEYIQERDERSK